MNPPKGSKPFDLLAALNGAPVVTRNGRKIVRLVYDTKKENGQPLIPYLFEGEAQSTLRHWSDGAYYIDKSESTFDLFMAPKTGWLNLYRGCGRVSAGPVHGSRASAEAWSSDENYIKTVKIPVE